MFNNLVIAGTFAGFLAGVGFSATTQGERLVTTLGSPDEYAVELTSVLAQVEDTAFEEVDMAAYAPPTDHTEIRYFENRIAAANMGTEELYAAYHDQVMQLIRFSERFEENAPIAAMKPLADGAYAFWYEMQARGLPVPEGFKRFDVVWLELNNG